MNHQLSVNKIIIRIQVVGSGKGEMRVTFKNYRTGVDSMVSKD